jgi:hypothetical protein
MHESQTDPVLSATVRIPEHVVHRSFVSETVVLNLRTGKYHSANPTGGRMLDVLEDCESLGEAAELLADDFDVPLERVTEDLVRFCRDLEERSLIELSSVDGH